MMRIEGITIKNYRSFDNDGIELENLGNINILIGKNNSGKSNVLKFISSLNRFLTINSSNMGYLKTNDFYNYNEQNDVACSLKVNKGMLYLPDAILEYFKNIGRSVTDILDVIDFDESYGTGVYRKFCKQNLSESSIKYCTDNDLIDKQHIRLNPWDILKMMNTDRFCLQNFL